MKKPIVLLAVLLVAGMMAALLWPRAEAAPDFTLRDLNGQSISQQDFQGKVTVLNFWYPSCPGCVSEMPKLIKMARDYQPQSEFQIIGISLPYDPESSVRNYVSSRQIPFTIAIDTDGSVGKTYNVQVAPMSFLIDKQGRLQKSFLGEPDFADLYRQVDELLAQ